MWTLKFLSMNTINDVKKGNLRKFQMHQKNEKEPMLR